MVQHQNDRRDDCDHRARPPQDLLGGRGEVETPGDAVRRTEDKHGGGPAGEYDPRRPLNLRLEVEAKVQGVVGNAWALALAAEVAEAADRAQERQADHLLGRSGAAGSVDDNGARGVLGLVQE